MGGMMAALAHQIRTPLAASFLYASNMQESDPLIADDHAGGQRLLHCLRRIENTVNDMLLFAKGKWEATDELSAAELAAALRSKLLTTLPVDAKCINVDDRCPGARLRVNQEALLGAIGNLVTNAVEAGSTRVEILLRKNSGRDSNLEISVRDNGPGVPAKVRAQLFEPFFTTRVNGTGLGLAVVRAVADAHGGDVRLATSTEEGARFTLSLPVLPPAPLKFSAIDNIGTAAASVIA